MLKLLMVLAGINFVSSVLQCSVQRKNGLSDCILERVSEMSLPIVELENDSTVSLLKRENSALTNLTISLNKEINYDIILQIQKDFKKVEQWEILAETWPDFMFPVKITIISSPPHMVTHARGRLNY